MTNVAIVLQEFLKEHLLEWNLVFWTSYSMSALHLYFSFPAVALLVPQSEAASWGERQRRDALSHCAFSCSLSLLSGVWCWAPHTDWFASASTQRHLEKQEVVFKGALFLCLCSQEPRHKPKCIYFYFFIDKSTSEAVPLVSLMQRKDALTQKQDQCEIRCPCRHSSVFEASEN